MIGLALMEFWKWVFQILESLISILGLDQVCFGLLQVGFG